MLLTTQNERVSEKFNNKIKISEPSLLLLASGVTPPLGLNSLSKTPQNQPPQNPFKVQKLIFIRVQTTDH